MGAGIPVIKDLLGMGRIHDASHKLNMTDAQNIELMKRTLPEEEFIVWKKAWDLRKGHLDHKNLTEEEKEAIKKKALVLEKERAKLYRENYKLYQQKYSNPKKQGFKNREEFDEYHKPKSRESNDDVERAVENKNSDNAEGAPRSEVGRILEPEGEWREFLIQEGQKKREENIKKYGTPTPWLSEDRTAGNDDVKEPYVDKRFTFDSFSKEDQEKILEMEKENRRKNIEKYGTPFPWLSPKEEK